MTLDEAIQYAEEKKLHLDIIRYLREYKTMTEEIIKQSKSRINQLRNEIWQIECEKQIRRVNNERDSN